MARYIKCSEAVHQLVKVKAAQLGIEMQEFAEKALRAQLDGASAEVPGTIPPNAGIAASPQNSGMPKENITLQLHEIAHSISELSDMVASNFKSLAGGRGHGKGLGAPREASDDARAIKRILETVEKDTGGAPEVARDRGKAVQRKRATPRKASG